MGKDTDDEPLLSRSCHFWGGGADIRQEKQVKKIVCHVGKRLWREIKLEGRIDPRLYPEDDVELTEECGERGEVDSCPNAGGLMMRAQSTKAVALWGER